MSQVERCALVLTALPVEYAAVRAFLKNLREEEDAVGTVYEVGTFDSDDSRWTVCLCEIGVGNVGAATKVERALHHFSPAVAFFVGIAGGIKDVSIGDVVIATKVYGYESGKSASGVFLPRPDVANSSYRLIERARAEARRGLWYPNRNRLLHTGKGKVPRAFVTPIAAGEKVVASEQSETARFLRENYGDALAVEMEGAGFLRALHAHVDIAALVIRGISDLLSGKADADRRGSQTMASRNAAAFAMAILARLGAAPGAYELPSSQNRTKVFLSYSHDSVEHQNRVLELAQQLRADGIDCWMDVFEPETPSMGWPFWMDQQLSESQFVLVVCSETFSRRFVGEEPLNAGLGTAWESQFTEQMLRSSPLRLRQFVPVLFEGASSRDVPVPLRPLRALRLPAEYDALLRLLSGTTSVGSLPSLGLNPETLETTGSDDKDKSSAARIFVSYSHRDESFREDLDKHLAILRRQGIIQLWHDRRITPGSDWDGQIDSALSHADIVIPLVSADFLASDYCYEVELRQALEWHRAGRTHVVPIIVRPCDWTSSPLGSIQALPRDARPVSAWANADDAWLDVAKALRTVATLANGSVSEAAVQRPSGQTNVAPPPPVVRPIEVIFQGEAFRK